MPKHIRVLAVVAGVLGVLLIISFIYQFFAGGRDIAGIEFSVPDTARITKVFLARKEGFKVNLEKKRGVWYVNGKYECRKDAIKNLLTVLKRIRVKMPVPSTARDNILKMLSHDAVKVEVYTDDPTKPEKVYYIGGSTPNKDGSFALLEGAQNPYVVYMEGHYGFLSPFFFVEEHLWRARTIWKYKYYEIYSVSVEYPERPEESFEIIQKGEQQIDVVNPTTGKSLTNIDTQKVYRYLALFHKFEYDYLMPYSKDSILPQLNKETPSMIVRVTDFQGKTTTLKLYLKPPSEEEITFEGEKPRYDLFGMYGVINDTELATVQYVMIDRIKWKIGDFQKPAPIPVREKENVP